MNSFSRFIALPLTIIITIFIIDISNAHARPLTTESAYNFVKSMPAIKTMFEDMEANGMSIQNAMKTTDMSASLEEEGFRPFTNAATTLKTAYPQSYTALGQTIKKYNFSSQTEWADAGNQVMAAYLVLKVEQSGQTVAAMKAQLSQMNPTMLAKLPPQARAQIEASMHIMDTMSKVPEESKTIVRPYMDEIAAWN